MSTTANQVVEYLVIGLPWKKTLKSKTIFPHSEKHIYSRSRGESHKFTSWGEGAFLALLGHLSSDGVMIKMPYGVDVLLHQPALHPIFSY